MKKILFAGALFCSLVAVISSIPIDFGVEEPSLIPDPAQNGLNLNVSTSTFIEGVYVDETGGITFTTETDGKSYYIQVTTTDGEPIITIRASYEPTSIGFLSISGREFVIISNFADGTVSVTPYFVPAEYQKRVEHAFDQGASQELMDLREQLLSDPYRVNEEEKDAIIEFLQCLESDLIISAAKALESSGIEESEGLAAITFQDFALQLEIARMKLDSLNQEQTSLQRHARNLPSGCECLILIFEFTIGSVTLTVCIELVCNGVAVTTPAGR